jgi:hypothetical protein
MKKAYQKPALEVMGMEQESMMAASSLGIYEDSMGASDALSNEESDINVWE